MAIGNLFGSGGESNSLYGTSLTSGGSIPAASSFIYFEWFIFKVSASQPATPTGGSWDFLTNTGTAPTGWTSSVSGIPLDNLWFSIAFVDSRNPTGFTWSNPGLISATTSVYASAYADKFTGNGSTTAWTLSADPVTVQNLDVSVNGVTQTPTTDYTISGTTFTTTTAAPLGSIILVKYRQALPNSYYGLASNVGYTPHNWIASTNVQTALNEVADDIAAVDGVSGSNLVGYKPAGTGAVATTVQVKLRQSVSVVDFGADPTGVSDSTSAIQLAVNYAATVNGAITFPNTGTFTFVEVVVPSNVTIYGNGAKLQAPSGYDSTSTQKALFEATSATNIKFLNLNFGLAALTDQVVFIRLDTCSYVTVNSCYFIENKYSAVSILSSTNISVTNNTMLLGASGTDFGVGVKIFGNSQRFDISNNTISGYKVTQFNGGIGVQPTGDKWGSVAIGVTMSSSFPGNSSGWQNITGTYTLPNNSPSPYVITDSRITNPSEWEGAALLTVDSVTGAGTVYSNITVTFGVGTMTLSNLPGSASGAVVTYQAFYYGYAPRYGTVNNNRISGMIYAGISIITGRDITAQNNYVERIGDLGFDPEGTQRVSVSNSTFVNCSTSGAASSGGYGHITGCDFNGGTYGPFKPSGNFAYQGFSGVGLAPLNGYTMLKDNNIQNTTSSPILLNTAPYSQVVNNSDTASNIAGTLITNTAYLTVRNNNFATPVTVTGSNSCDISENNITLALQANFVLTSLNKFKFTNNTVNRSTSAFGSGIGLTYTSCTTGYIQNNWFMNMSGTSVVDGGGNTSVTVSANTTL